MNSVQPPSQKPGDDFDGLLRAFFRRQMPQRWPSPPRFPAAPIKHPSTSGRSLIRSRLALAASLALLLLGSLLLPSRFTQDAKPEQILNAPTTADRNILPKPSKRHESKANENKNKPGLAADDDQLPEVDESDMPLLK